MDKNRNGYPIFPSISSIIVALLPGLIGRSGSKWTINTKRLNIKSNFWDVLSPLHKGYYNHNFDRSTIFHRRKCGSGPDDLALHRQKRVPVLREGFINFPAPVRFGQKGFLCTAKRSFFPDCRVPDLEGKGLLWED